MSKSMRRMSGRALNKAVIGWDVGGAHLKAALTDGRGRVDRILQLPCPLWQGLTHLEQALAQALNDFGAPRARHALTMTGELSDIFPDRATGVAAITELTQKKLHTVRVYAGRKGFVSPARAQTLAEHVASANWLASAMFAASRVKEALLVDVGSTTTDLILLKNGNVHARGFDDHRRMVHDELVYTGAVRTPVMAVVSRVPFAGEQVGVMAEHFATLADVYRLTGELPEAADQLPAADGGEKSARASAQRLARMVGLDLKSVPLVDWKRLAAYIAEQQMQRLFEACMRQFTLGIVSDRAPLIGAGVGSFVVKKLARRGGRSYRDFSALVKSNLSDRQWVNGCAPAVAVALLAGKAA